LTVIRPTTIDGDRQIAATGAQKWRLSRGLACWRNFSIPRLTGLWISPVKVYF